MAERMTPRKKQALEMRARIQNTALDLFDQKGFENVSMEEIAQAVGCSTGNIYHYFKGKDELAIQVTSHVDAAYLDLEQEYRRSTLTAREKLVDFVQQTLAISAQEEVLYKSFIHSLKHPDQAILRIKPERAYFRILRDLIAACQAESSIRPSLDTDELLLQFVAIHRGLLFEWRVEVPFDLPEMGRKMAEAMLKGLE